MGLIKRSSEYAYSEGAKGLHAAELQTFTLQRQELVKELNGKL